MADPYTPYPISGTVYKPDSSTVLANAIVNTLNETTGEELPSNKRAITNDSGQYTIDLANLPTGYSNGDTIVVEVVGGYRSVQYRTTVDTSTGYENKDLITTYYNVLGLVIDLLSDNWQQGNVGVKDPSDADELIIDEVMNQKGLDLQTTDRDYILLYEMPALFLINGFGASTRRMIFPLSIDIRTGVSRTHAMRLKNEVDRILGSNIVLGNTIYGYDFVNNYRGWTDRSDGSIGMWRIIIDVQLEKSNASTTIGGGS